MTATYRQILAHADPTRSLAPRLEAALRIATENGAALTVLYAATPLFAELPYAPEVGPIVTPDLIALDQRRCRDAKKVFEAVARDAGPTVRWSQTVDVPVISVFAQQALYADLLVLGQQDRSDAQASAIPPDFVESVLSASGRPAVVLPYAAVADTFGAIVAIAWKPTPQAARAVTAAMPFLQRARQVHVLTWGEEEDGPLGDARLDLASYLRAHGVEMVWHRGGPEPSAIGELLLSRVFDLGADLLVMGCYGHSRAREWVLGGASRTVLASMTVPVLMCH